MSSYLDDPMHQSFLAGQAKLDRERAEAEARAAEEDANRVYYMSSAQTPEQRLYQASSVTLSFGPTKEAPLTEAERRGMSEEAFNALRPELRLEIYNQAIHARNGFAKRKRR